MATVKKTSRVQHSQKGKAKSSRHADQNENVFMEIKDHLLVKPQESRPGAKVKLYPGVFNFSDDSDFEDEQQIVSDKVKKTPLKELNKQPHNSSLHEEKYAEILSKQVKKRDIPKASKSAARGGMSPKSAWDNVDMPSRPQGLSARAMSGKKKLFSQSEEPCFQSTPKEAKTRRKPVNLFQQRSILQKLKSENVESAEDDSSFKSKTDHLETEADTSTTSNQDNEAELSLDDYVEVQDRSVQTSLQPVHDQSSQSQDQSAELVNCADYGDKHASVSNTSGCSSQTESPKFATNMDDCDVCGRVSNMSHFSDVSEPSLIVEREALAENQIQSLPVSFKSPEKNLTLSHGDDNDLAQGTQCSQTAAQSPDTRDLANSDCEQAQEVSSSSQRSPESLIDNSHSSCSLSSQSFVEVQDASAQVTLLEEGKECHSKSEKSFTTSDSQRSCMLEKDVIVGSSGEKSLTKSQHSDMSQQDMDVDTSSNIPLGENLEGAPHQPLCHIPSAADPNSPLPEPEQLAAAPQDPLVSPGSSSTGQSLDNLNTSTMVNDSLYVTALEPDIDRASGVFARRKTLYSGNRKSLDFGAYRESSVLVAETDSEPEGSLDESSVMIEASESEDGEEDSQSRLDDDVEAYTEDMASGDDRGCKHTSQNASTNNSTTHETSGGGAGEGAHPPGDARLNETEGQGKSSPNDGGGVRYSGEGRVVTHKFQTTGGLDSTSGSEADRAGGDKSTEEITEKLRSTNLSSRRNRRKSDSSDDDGAFEKFLNKMKAPTNAKTEEPTLEKSMDDFIVADDEELSEESTTESSSSEDEMFHVRVDNIVDVKRERVPRLRKPSPDVDDISSEESEQESLSPRPVFELTSDDDDLLDEDLEDKKNQTGANCPSSTSLPNSTLSLGGALLMTPVRKPKINSQTPLADKYDDDDDNDDDDFKTPFKTPARPVKTLKPWERPFETPAVNLTKTVHREISDMKLCPSTIARFSRPPRHSNIGLDDDSVFLKSLSEDYPDYKRHPEASRYVKYFKEKRDKLTQKLFAIYNKSVFGEQLPADLEIEWSTLYRKTAGTFTSKRGPNPEGKITLSAKVCDRPERVRDTLAHELCHAAVRLVNNVRESHGPVWRSWAQKVNRAFPFMPVIARCHDYVIATKYTYKCTKCNYRIGRHSKSLDTDKKVCGHCLGKFEVFLTRDLNSSTGSSTPATPCTPSRTPNKFALFVKESYGKVKKEDSSLKHGDVMKILSRQFAEKNNISDAEDLS